MQYDINGRILAREVNDLIAEEISVFPNPTTNKLAVKGFPQSLSAANCSVVSVDGKQVQVDVLDNKTLDSFVWRVVFTFCASPPRRELQRFDL